MVWRNKFLHSQQTNLYFKESKTMNIKKMTATEMANCVNEMME